MTKSSPAFRHRQTDADCPLSDVKQAWSPDVGVYLVCVDCEGAVEMPCPYCDYVRQPNKSGFGMTVHIMQKHPEHHVAVPAERFVLDD